MYTYIRGSILAYVLGMFNLSAYLEKGAKARHCSHGACVTYRHVKKRGRRRDTVPATCYAPAAGACASHARGRTLSRTSDTWSSPRAACCGATVIYTCCIASRRRHKRTALKQGQNEGQNVIPLPNKCHMSRKLAVFRSLMHFT